MKDCKKDCKKQDKICNPESGRCLKKTTKKGKEILKKYYTKKTTKKSQEKKSQEKKFIKHKSPDKLELKNKKDKKSIRHDLWVGEEINAKGKKMKPCKKHQYRRKDGRCVNKPGYKKVKEKKVDKKKIKIEKEYIEPSKDNIWFGEEINAKGKKMKPCKKHQYRRKDGRCINKEIKKKEKRNVIKRNKKYTRWKNIIKTPGSCIKQSNVSLRELQIKVINYMEENTGLLVVHSTGCGKTLTSIGVSQCYLNKFPEKNIIFVGPASLISNFKKEMKKYGVKNSEKYTFYSYDKFMNLEKKGETVNCKNSLLIIDEAHNLRNNKSKKYNSILNCSMKADKRLLLTATPFVNNIQDFIPLINLIYGEKVVGTLNEFNNNIVNDYIDKEISPQSISTIKYFLHDKVDMVDCIDDKYYPKEITHKLDIKMSKQYYKIFQEVLAGENLYGVNFSKPERFYNGFRRVVNKTANQYYSRKIKEIMPILKNGKSIVYTNWIEFGIDPVKLALEKEGLSYKTFYGKVNMKDRKQIVKDFNEDKFKVLVLTKAGGEGLDLKGVRNVFILDPTWNESGIRQIIGRAIRFKSHHHLPVEERKVNVYYLRLVAPDGSDNINSGDVLLYEIIKKKREIFTLILETLKNVSIS